MTVDELAAQLLAQGCNPSLYAIGSRGAASDVFYLSQVGGRWQVCYTERGRDAEPIYVSASESEACQFFFEHVMAMRHDHCVGFFDREDEAVALRRELGELGVQSWIDTIPYGGERDLRYRVFVVGKGIHVAMAVLGEGRCRGVDLTFDHSATASVNASGGAMES